MFIECKTYWNYDLLHAEVMVLLDMILACIIFFSFFRLTMRNSSNRRLRFLSVQYQNQLHQFLRHTNKYNNHLRRKQLSYSMSINEGTIFRKLKNLILLCFDDMLLVILI